MKRRSPSAALLVAVTAAAVLAANSVEAAPLAGRAIPHASLGGPFQLRTRSLALTFDANRGQEKAGVSFAAHATGTAVYVTDGGADVVLARPAASGRGVVQKSAPTTAPVMTDTVRLDLLGAAKVPARGGRPAGVTNYLVGPQQRWVVGVPSYADLLAPGVYPGVDVAYHSAGSDLEYDFVVAPGADPTAIRFAFDGAAVTRAPDGSLILKLRGGSLTVRPPVAYQSNGSSQNPVAAAFKLDPATGAASFALGPYNHSRPLVIDPVLAFSTYLGGSGYDSGRAVAVDAAGNTYVAGLTTSADFPSVGGPPTGAAGHYHVFVTKLGPSGIVYSTIIGGSGDEQALALAVDAAGAVTFTGSTNSADFPTVNPSQAGNRGGGDAFVARLAASGASLVYSTLVGGSSSDTGYGVALDATGAAYVTGLTYSPDFPVTAGAFQAASGGGGDAFVAKYTPAGGLVYSTYVGGSGSDAGLAIGVDSSGAATIAGSTYSANFPVRSALQPALRGTSNAFVARLNPAGSAEVFATYLGGSGYDVAMSLALNQAGDVYLTGYTTSANFPLANAALPQYLGTGGHAFVTRLSRYGNQLIFSTFLGGSGYDQAYGIAVDWYGNAYVGGVTTSPDFPSVNSSQGYGGGKDGFVTAFTPGGALLLYSGYVGGGSDDAVLGVTSDRNGDVYLTGFTYSSNFPTSAPTQAAPAGGADAFVAMVGGVLNQSWWPTYLADTSHTGINRTQILLNQFTAQRLHITWANRVNGMITTQPILGNGLIYWGSWDGYERASDPSGNVVWQDFLGTVTNNNPGCLGGTVGIVDMPTLITVGNRSIMYIGGGDGAVYALDAMTGQAVWRTSLGTPPAQYLWASPAYYGGSVYEGVASLQECPAVQGQLVQMDAATGAVQHVFKTVPDGCTGAPVLASPAFDDQGNLYIATGSEPHSCANSLATAVLKLRASDLTLLDSWQIPAAEQVITDADFGASPMLFTATINGVQRNLFGLVNKDGTYYAFDRANLAAGPVWRATNIGVPGNCPTCGAGAPISPSSYDGTRILVGSNQTTIAGAVCAGSVRSLDPATGTFLWEKCLNGPLLGAISETQGVAFFGAGSDIYAISAADGTTLFDFHDPYAPLPPLQGADRFWSGVAIGQGVIYEGSVGGYLFALSE